MTPRARLIPADAGQALHRHAALPRLFNRGHTWHGASVAAVVFIVVVDVAVRVRFIPQGVLALGPVEGCDDVELAVPAPLCLVDRHRARLAVLTRALAEGVVHRPAHFTHLVQAVSSIAGQTRRKRKSTRQESQRGRLTEERVGFDWLVVLKIKAGLLHEMNNLLAY